ncbi:hypothetical protein [Methanobacterium alcaliphilum]|nr:hypothetical protein [Methanobacterium alcaliphilum]MCK9150420.1 hypothetical protein [Methanobacterium alcaliphilum]
MNKEIQYINPDTSINNPGFSQMVVTPSDGKTIYIGGKIQLIPRERQ